MHLMEALRGRAALLAICHLERTSLLAILTLLKRSVASLLGFPPLLPFCLTGPTEVDCSLFFFPGCLLALLPVFGDAEESMKATLSSAVLLLVLAESLPKAFSSSLRSRLGASDAFGLLLCACCA